jgi:hypothetical protein
MTAARTPTGIHGSIKLSAMIVDDVAGVLGG